MVVLTSRFTSAGHVFLVAALQDSGRAVVVGERTPGNTYVRSLIDIPGRDEQVTLATAVMERADGTPLLVPPGQRSAIPRIELEKLALERKRKTGFILPDHEVSGGAVPRGRDYKNDQIIKTAIDVINQSLGASNVSANETAD